MSLSVNRFFGTAAAAACLFAAQPANAETFSFLCITSNSPNCSSVSSQMSVEVLPGLTPDKALFTFFNTAVLSSSIAEVYFQSTVLTTPLTVGFGVGGTTAGVAFTPDGPNPNQVAPPDLPGGNAINPPFNVTVIGTGQNARSLSADAGNTADGVDNVGERLQLIGTLSGANTFDTLLASFANGSTRIGIHVRSIGLGGAFSESMITVVPVPGALPLMATGLLAVGYMARRRKSS